MDVFDLVAKLSLDTSDAESGLNKFKSGIGGVAGKIGGAVGTMAKAVVGATAAAGAAVTGFAASAVKTGMEFDSSMSQVAATMGMSMSDIENNVNGAADTFQALRDKAREMGGSTIYSAQEAAEGLNILAMSGYDATQSMDMLEDVLHLAAAGSMDMANAAGYISGAMKGFNDETKDSAYYADLMAKGATLANTSVEQLGEAMSGGAATAASYNQSADSMTLSLLRLAEQGEVGSAASTALAAAMKDIYTGSDQAKKALKELGVEAYDPVTKEAKDFNDVVNELEASMQGMTDEEKNNYKQTIFGIQGLKAYNKMVVTSTDKQKEWKKSLSEATGAAAQQYETMTDNLEGAIKGWGSALDDFKIQVSDKLSPIATKIVKFGTESMQKLTAAFKEGGIDGAIDELGNILSKGIEKLTDAIPDIMEVGGKLLGALAQGFSDNIEVIITAAGNIALQLLRGLVDATNGEGGGVVGKIISAISAFFEEHGEEMLGLGKQLLLNIFNGITSNIKSAVGGLVDLVSGIAGWLSEEGNLSDLVGAAVAIVTTLATAISDNAAEIGTSAADLVAALAEAIIEHAPDLIPAAIELVVALADGVYGARDRLGKKGPDLITALAKGIKSSLQKIYNLGPETINKFIDAIQTFLPNLIPAGGNFIINIIQGISQHWGELKTAATQTVTYFGEQIKATITQATTWGADLIQNFINGIKQKWNALKGAVGDVAQGIKNKLGHSHPVEGPLADDYKWMPDMMDLFIEGISNNKNRLYDTIDDTFNFGERITTPDVAVTSGSITGAGVPERDVTVILQVDKTQLAKTVFQLNRAESKRMGVQLANA